MPIAATVITVHPCVGSGALSRPIASAALAVVMILLILVLPQRPGAHPRTSGQTA